MAKSNLTIEVERLKKEFYQGMTKLRESQAELRESQKKTDEEIDKLLGSQKETAKRVGDLTDGWGKFVEGTVAPCIPKLFKKVGINVDFTAQNVERTKDGGEMEVDILCEGKSKEKDMVIAVEVKTTLDESKVDEWIERLKDFFKFFDKYRDYSLIGVIGGMKLSKGVVRYAERKGLYVLTPSGNAVKLANKPEFKPRIWR